LPFSPAGLSAEEAIAENLQRIRGWWRTVSPRPLTQAEDFGVMPLAYEAGDKRIFILQVAALATIVAGDPRPADRPGFVNSLNRARFFHRLMEDAADGLVVFEELEWFSADPGHTALAENLFHVLRQRAALAARPELPDELAGAEGASALCALLREHLFGAGAGLEPHWMVRELVRGGIWDAEAVGDAAVVPTRETLEAGYRLGLLDRPDADGPAELLAASATLAGLLGPQDAFGEPFGHLHEHFGCAWGCRYVAGCPFHCREKRLG